MTVCLAATETPTQHHSLPQVIHRVPKACCIAVVWMRLRAAHRRWSESIAAAALRVGPSEAAETSTAAPTTAPAAPRRRRAIGCQYHARSPPHGAGGIAAASGAPEHARSVNWVTPAAIDAVARASTMAARGAAAQAAVRHCNPLQNIHRRVQADQRPDRALPRHPVPAVERGNTQSSTAQLELATQAVRKTSLGLSGSLFTLYLYSITH